MMSAWLSALLVAPGAPETGSRIDFEAALAAAETRPEVQAVEARRRVRSELDRGLGALTNDPYVQVQPGYRFAPVEANQGFDGMVTVQQQFNLEGWGNVRRAAAATERTALGHRVLAARRSARREAARAWLQTWALARELELRRRMLEDAQTLQAKTERALELGMSSRVEQAQARAHLARARLEVLDAEGRWFESGLGLAAACGRAEGPLFAEGPLPRLAPPQSEVLEVDEDPELLVARAEARAASQRMEEAAAQEGWQILTGLNLMHEPTEQIVPSATLGLTLPVSGRNRRETAERAADRAAAEREVSAAAMAMRRLRIRALHEVEHTQSVSHQYQQHLLPARREEVDALARELELGGTSFRRVLDARTRLLEAEVDAVSATARHHAAVFELKLLVDAPVEDRS